MREYPFELALCAHLEANEETVVARQIGGGVRAPSNRVLDVVCVEPGPEMDARADLTPSTIPDLAVESDVGVGRARDPVAAIDARPERARSVAERAVEIGFFERGVGGGVRRVARYPDDWFGKLVAIENKPDLGDPGDLRTQLRKDASLALADEVILATESYVTGAHLNRIPEEVGVWRFDPESGDREEVREPTPLDADGWGLELLDEHPLRTDVAAVPPEAKARQRRRTAERAYGKGWRPDAFPACAEVEPVAREGSEGLPFCRWKDRVVNPARCGPDCPGHDPADPPEVDPEAARAGRTPWVADPEGKARRQSGLDRFG
ncbi:DUF5787 family protein [Halorussus gelatinilyticus]|uniref:DUF5787 family protein n=1 Tax=Halorussus gelatinilyticus TaxID=2937524 RepID=A0A8U0ILC5_9EURY|nr:DUF5787 family protein [Halorussus gelatinilyticus]UPW01455.1 DUF5787 family protein [Halorussus gelatinilyticus]